MRAVDAARELGVSARVLRRWIDTRQIAGLLLGGRWYVRRVELDRLRDGKPKPPPE